MAGFHSTQSSSTLLQMSDNFIWNDRCMVYN